MNGFPFHHHPHLRWFFFGGAHANFYFFYCALISQLGEICMRSYIRTKLPLLLMVVVMLSAVAIPLVLSTLHSRPTHAATPATVTIPSMKLPWDRSLTTIPFTGGPNGNYPDTTCTLENKSIMSGVDFGLPQNTNVLAVAAGKVIYARYTDSQIRNEVRIDHGGGFVTEYWDLNAIDPSITKGVTVAQGQLLGKSGYAPCPKCKNGISVHLRLQFRQYTSNPLLTTPLSAYGMAIDGYTIWTFIHPSTGQGYNFQGYDPRQDDQYVPQ
jgi:Peptidase family M23